MSADQHFERAQLLYQQKRVADAEREIMQCLSHEPANAQALCLLAQIMLHSDRVDEALTVIRSAISADPENYVAYHIYGFILLEKDEYTKAIEQAKTALQINPHDADCYGLWAQALLLLKEYSAAADKAAEGLARNPENLFCLNVRSRALLKAGHKEAAYESVDRALENDPENAYTHTNYGWNKLEQGKRQEALHHFREALRIDPNFDSARSGMAEALKAKFPVYRWWLAYVFWIGNMKQGLQWGIIIGMWLGIRGVGMVGDSNPELLPYIMPLVWLYMLFAFTTWTIVPLTDLFFRFNKYGKHLLSREEIRTANITGVFLATGLLSGLVYAFVDLEGLLALCIFGLSMIIPVAGALAKARNTPKWLVYYTIALGVVGLGGVASAFAVNDVYTSIGSFYLFGWVAFTWIANFARK